MSIKFPDLSAASCAQVGFDHFFPHPSEKLTSKHLRPIKELCDSCPVVQACLTYALYVEVEGIWGGTTFGDRRSIRKELGIESMSIHAQYQLEGTFAKVSQAAQHKRDIRAKQKLEREQGQ